MEFLQTNSVSPALSSYTNLIFNLWHLIRQFSSKYDVILLQVTLFYNINFYLSIYGSTALLDIGHFFSFLNTPINGR
jgi:hypothetical protein